jgi:WD40 repeat protein
MQPSPKKSFKSQKTIQSPHILRDSNQNGRYIQPRQSFLPSNALHSPSPFAFPNSLQDFFCAPFSDSLFAPCWESSSSRSLSRKPSSKPFKILDAPELQDNFYYSVLDWSEANMVSVALASRLFLYSVGTGLVCELLSSAENVSAVRSSRTAPLLAVGLENGEQLVVDVQRQAVVRHLPSQSTRVGVIRWNEQTVTSGSREGKIMHCDLRAEECFCRFRAHTQEVCGLEWDCETLASGSNDNLIKVWENYASVPSVGLRGHSAAVKSLAWSPWERKVLVSGGGASDKTIKVWNTLTGKKISETDTGSQICCMLFSQNSKELVTGHGFTRNEISLWSYPEMSQTAVYRGHDERVLYMALAPDGQDLVTGAADRTLRFWHMFKPSVRAQPLDSTFAMPMR